jgi:flagellar biosynthesis protein FlhG
MNQVESEKRGEIIYRKLNDIAGQFLEANLSYLGCVRYDHEIVHWIRQRQPFVLADPRANASRDLVDIAKVLGNRASVFDSDEELVSRLERAFGIKNEKTNLQVA